MEAILDAQTFAEMIKSKPGMTQTGSNHNCFVVCQTFTEVENY
jgi:hypothetical protein